MCGGTDIIEQRTYLKYCNGAETFYSYDPARRRLQNLMVNAKAGTIMDNAYSYDAVSNVLGIKNNAPLPQSGKAGGQMSHSYSYDPLYRLASATGTYKGTDNKAASYTLSMGYDNMHRITSKKQHLSQTGVHSSTARSTQAMTSPIPMVAQRVRSSSLTMFVILTTERKKLLRTAPISTTDTSTLTMPMETLSISIPLV